MIVETKQYTPAAINADFVILDFWFVGSVPCMEDHKRIEEFLPFLKQKAELISISNDDSYQKWKDYLGNIIIPGFNTKK